MKPCRVSRGPPRAAPGSRGGLLQTASASCASVGRGEMHKQARPCAWSFGFLLQACAVPCLLPACRSLCHSHLFPAVLLDVASDSLVCVPVSLCLLRDGFVVPMLAVVRAAFVLCMPLLCLGGWWTEGTPSMRQWIHVACLLIAHDVAVLAQLTHNFGFLIMRVQAWSLSSTDCICL